MIQDKNTAWTLSIILFLKYFFQMKALTSAFTCVWYVCDGVEDGRGGEKGIIDN